MLGNTTLGSQKGLLILGGLAIVGLIIGIIAGYNMGGSAEPQDPSAEKAHKMGMEYKTDTTPDVKIKMMAKDYKKLIGDKFKDEENLLDTLINRIDAKKIGENLKYLSEEPHLAASPRDEILAKFVQKRFEEAGFDRSDLVPMNFLLSRPNQTDPNKITLTKGSQTLFESHHKEVPIHEDDEDPNFIHAFNAFTPAATISTTPGVGVVYVNYGRIEDFKELETLGVNVTGHIALARYGKIYRGNKVEHAQRFGAIGLIIFSDPADVALKGIDPEDVYDKSFWLPGTGIQRGNTYLGKGDPLTPGWPSTEHAYRIDIEDAELAKIPTQPIGYTDAQQILEKLSGAPAPEEWQGGLPGLTYNMGPSWIPEHSDLSLTLSTHNYVKVFKSYNVFGIIKGETEPDRYVMIGNHRDAWGYGAADPSSGTAQLLETARVFGTLLKDGWRPRRTMVFCSWGSEEYGLIGSTEWVEQHVDKLQARAVSYLNTDTCASGPIVNIKASPMLQGIFPDIAKKIPGVVDSSRTLLEEWVENNMLIKPDAEEFPIMGTLGSGSDYAHLTFFAGIPAADLWFRRDKALYNISIYAAYHTGYETYYLMSQYIDPGFKRMQGCGRVASLFLKQMADSAILPYSIEKFPKLMLKGLKESKNRDALRRIYDKYDELENAVVRFEDATKKFSAMITNVGPTLGPLQVRAVNDQLMQLEQTFIMPQGLPNRPSVRHAIFAPSQFDSYASAGFPGLSDLLFEYEELNPEDKIKREKMIKMHISDLTIMTDRATSLLESVDII